MNDEVEKQFIPGPMVPFQGARKIYKEIYIYKTLKGIGTPHHQKIDCSEK